MSSEMDLESRIRHLHGPDEVTYEEDDLAVVCRLRVGALKETRQVIGSRLPKGR